MKLNHCPECGSCNYFVDGIWHHETGEQTAEYMLCRDCGHTDSVPKWVGPTDEEVQAAYDTAPAVPLSADRINEIVRYATKENDVRHGTILIEATEVYCTQPGNREGCCMGFAIYRDGQWEGWAQSPHDHDELVRVLIMQKQDLAVEAIVKFWSP